MATVEAAALSRSTSLSDAEPLVRAMLVEHGIEVPHAKGEQSEYRALRYAFGYVEGARPSRSALVTLLDQRDHVTSQAERDAVEQEMRAVVRSHVAAV